MTIPTIAELQGNTILELFNNGYNSIKNSVYSKDETDDMLESIAEEIPDMSLYYTKQETYSRSEIGTRLATKQDKLIAGDNIVIDEETNTISAIEGGSLDDYYTKEETDSLLADKADSDDVYTKTEIDTNNYTKSEVNTLVAASGYKIINTVTPTVMSNPNAIKIEGLQDGDIIELNFKDRQKPAGTTEFTETDVHLMFVYKTNINEIVGTYTSFNPTIVGSTFTGSWCIVSVEAEATVVGNYLRIILSGTRGSISNGAFANEYTNCDGIVLKTYTIIRRA